MTFGLPLHLAERTFVTASTRASHVGAGICIAAAALILAILQTANLDLIVWPALLALIPVSVLLVLLDRRPSTLAAAAYLLIGTASLYWVALTITAQFALIDTSDAFLLGLVKVALILVAAPATRVRFRLVWCLAGYVAGEAATQAAVAQTAATPQFDVPVFIMFLLTLVLIVASAFGRRSTRLARPNLHRAARDEQLADLRGRMEAQAAALVHDTVLNSLSAIAASSPGRLTPALRSQLQADLDLLMGSEWLQTLTGNSAADDTGADAGTAGTNQGDPRNRLRAVIDECRELGLTIETTGDIATVSRLTPERSIALALAVKQCLINVARHSGTDKAQVAVYGTDTDVSVMVIDSGRGFSQQDTPGDRLGMRTSIHRRIEAVDGKVRVWSTPGRGTSVLMQVPAVRATDRRVTDRTNH